MSGSVDTRSRQKVVGVGYACLDQLLRWESVARPVVGNRLTGYDVQGGGMAATAMVAAARLGARAEFRGAVGADDLGEMIVRGLAREGVGTSHVVRVQRGSGPVGIVCVDGATGERHFHMGRSCPAAGPVDAGFSLAGVGCLLVDGCHRPSAVRMARAARRQGVPVVGDIGWLGDGVRELMRYVDYAVVPHHVANGLRSDEELAKACQAIHSYGPHTVVVTLGADGLAASDGKRFFRRGAYAVDVVDTTGAGDTFHGAFCFGLVCRLPLEANLALSSATAALKCRKLGGRAGIPSLPEVLAFLRKHDRPNWRQISALTRPTRSGR